MPAAPVAGQCARLQTLLVIGILGWAAVTAASAQPGPAGRRQPEEHAAVPLTLRTAGCAPAEGARPTAYTLAVRRPDAPAAEAVPSCQFGVAILSALADQRWVLHVRVVTRGALVVVRVAGSARNWLPDQPRVELGSDGAVPDIELALPRGIDGTVVVERADLGGEAIQFEAAVDARSAPTPVRDRLPDQRFTFDSGRTFRVGISPNHYRALVTLGQTVSAQTRVDAADKRAVHQLVSALIERDADQWRQSATRSEPVTMFVGLAGVNKIILSDAVAWPMVASETGGERLAEPWQTTFERARYFWAVYLEDDESPFFTSIDVQYGTRQNSSQHDDFDPQGVARFDVEVADGGLVPVRIGYKRLRIPDSLNVVQVTFSRQSSSYGLRQWSRTYSRYGRFPVRVAAGLMATFWPVTTRDLVFQPVYVSDSQQPTASVIDEDVTRQPIFALAALRFPQLRDSAGQAPLGLSRLWRVLTPEPVFGVGVPTITRRAEDGRTELAGFRGQSLAVGVSWPILGDRLHFVAAGLRFHEARSKPGVGELRIGRRFPPGTDLGDLKELRAIWSLLGGISVDLARTW